ncbi:MmcQ/YjbR family DNA-binding protein [Desemzia sp. FAM 24101]|uniref:MmcQ/YjbR family DNA-binding protein n=1 Tax=unclassified Desemzia TaxID=2685243 RepID=UPI00388B9443
MLTRNKLFQYMKKHYGAEPEYLWEKFPGYAVFKHPSNGKWYGVVMNILPEKIGLEGEEEIDVLELKSPPELNGSLKERREIEDAYHMNKEHWISVILGQVNEVTEIEQLIETSFDLTKS